MRRGHPDPDSPFAPSCVSSSATLGPRPPRPGPGPGSGPPCAAATRPRLLPSSRRRLHPPAKPWSRGSLSARPPAAPAARAASSVSLGYIRQQQQLRGMTITIFDRVIDGIDGRGRTGLGSRIPRSARSSSARSWAGAAPRPSSARAAATTGRRPTSAGPSRSRRSPSTPASGWPRCCPRGVRELPRGGRRRHAAAAAAAREERRRGDPGIFLQQGLVLHRLKDVRAAAEDLSGAEQRSGPRGARRAPRR